MNLIFMNSFEKKTAGDRAVRGQVSIGENQGQWQVAWSEPDSNGKVREQVWFQGTAWNDMLESFRSGIQDKVRTGYFPLIGGSVVRTQMQSRASRAVQLLQCFAESNADDQAMQALKQWRREKAQKEGKSAYFIATNRLLSMLAAFLPQNTDELRQIPGMGENRMQAYSDEMLAITRSRSEARGPELVYPLHWVEGKVAPEAFEAWLAEEGKRKERLERDRLENKKKLLEAISQGKELDELAKLTTIARRDLLVALEELDKEGYDLSGWLDSQLDRAEAREREEAERLFRELGDRYLKPVVRGIYSEEQLKEQDVNRLYERLRLYRMKFRRQAG